MFNKTAEYYDLIYSFKDYAREAASIQGLIQRERPDARTILDLACGTAEHARYLSESFHVDGLDLEPVFIEAARRKVPTGTFTLGDMRQFDLGKQFDVVLCLFSSIGYLIGPDDVVAALSCFSKHLSNDGVMLIEPWFTPDQWHVGGLHLTPVVDFPDIKICRMSRAGRDGNVSIVDFHYLIAEPEGVQHLEEVHRLALYSVDDMLSFFRRATLDVSYDPVGLTGRGLYVARRKA